MRKIIVAAGGTGGHLYPGLALARELKKRGHEVIFATKINDMSLDVIKQEGFKYYELSVMGMPRKITFKLFNFVINNIKAFFYALNVLSIEKPDSVAGMGGYVSFPIVVAARIKGIKTLIHEQNSFAGVANRVLSLIANKVALGFKAAELFFPQMKSVVTGNPVREEIYQNFTTLREAAYKKYNLVPNKFTILVFGGSQGAKKINECVAAAAKSLDKTKIQFLHLCGKGNSVEITATYKNTGVSACVLDYCNDMPSAYAVADYIISRAGASTISELEIINKPALLIPFPHATADHQRYNAKVLTDSLKATLLLESEMTAQKVAGYLNDAYNKFNSSKLSFYNIPKETAQAKIADIIEEMH